MARAGKLRERIWGTEAPGARGAGIRVLRLFDLFLEGAQRHGPFGTAAALGFMHLLAAPMAALFFIGCFRAFGKPTALADALRSAADSFLSSEHSRQVASRVTGWVEQMSAGMLLAISLIALVVIIIWMLATLERAFNTMWAVRRPRTALRRVSIYWLLMTVGSFGSLVSLWCAHSLFNTPLASLLTIRSGLFNPVVLIVLSFAVQTGMLMLVYVFLPSTHIPARAAVLGALVGAAGSELFRYLFFIWTTDVVADYPVYGPLLAVPMVFVGTLLTWVAVMLGAQFVYAAQHLDTPRREISLPTASYAARERLALRVTLNVCRAYLAGAEPPTIEKLSAALGMPLRLIEQVCFQLRGAGILREVARSEAPGGGLVPGRAPEQITPQHVLEALRAYGTDLGQLPADSAGDEVEDAISKAMDRVYASVNRTTFRDLAAAPAPKPPAPAREPRRT